MQIAPGLYSMRQDEGGHVHAFIVDDGQGLTLIDTLFNSDASVVLDELKQAGKQVTDIKNIILTHAHRSHIGGLAELKKLSNATVYSHEWEEDIISGKRKTTTPPIARFASRNAFGRDRLRNACDPVSTNAASSPATVLISFRRSSPSHCARSFSWISRASGGVTFQSCNFFNLIYLFPCRVIV